MYNILNVKRKRELFLRFARIKEISVDNNIHRIGINDSSQSFIENLKCIGSVRYIGIPTRCKEVHYKLQFKQAFGEHDGVYDCVRYFTTNKKCAYTIIHQ